MSETARLRAALHERFVAVLRADFDSCGEEAVQALRGKDPGAYLRAIVSILPDLKLQPASLNELSDDEVSVVLYAVRQAGPFGAGVGGGGEAAPRDQRVVSLSPISKARDVS